MQQGAQRTLLERP